MLLTDSELTKLIYLSTHDQVLSLRYGPGWVDLDEKNPNNQWAIEELKIMRGEIDGLHL